MPKRYTIYYRQIRLRSDGPGSSPSSTQAGENPNLAQRQRVDGGLPELRRWSEKRAKDSAAQGESNEGRGSAGDQLQLQLDVAQLRRAPVMKFRQGG